MLEQALAYELLGWSVIPVHSVKKGKCSCGKKRCSTPGKHPRVSWKEWCRKRADEKQIRAWWKRWPDANVGIVTGEISGIAVLDLDGKDGVNSLLEAGLSLEELPETPIAKTGGGGLHLYFEMPEDGLIKTSAGVLHGVDIRADGGFVVAPTSRHISGKTYDWNGGASPWDVDPARFDWELLMEVSRATKPKKRGPRPRGKDVKEERGWVAILLRGVKEGHRNEAATRLLGSILRRGACYEEAWFYITSWNKRNSPPLPEDELRRTLDSVWDLERASSGQMWRDKEPGELISDISQVLGVELVGIQRVMGENVKMLFLFADGQSVRMNHSEFWNHKSFQRLVAAQIGVTTRTLGKRTSPTWEKFRDLVMFAAEIVDAGTEATALGEILLLVNDFVQKAPRAPYEKGAPSRGVFEYDGMVWVSLMDVSTWATQRSRYRGNTKDLAQDFVYIGGVRRTFTTTKGSHRTAWGFDMRVLTRRAFDAACKQTEHADEGQSES